MKNSREIETFYEKLNFLLKIKFYHVKIENFEFLKTLLISLKKINFCIEKIILISKKYPSLCHLKKSK